MANIYELQRRDKQGKRQQLNQEWKSLKKVEEMSEEIFLLNFRELDENADRLGFELFLQRKPSI